MRGLTLFGAWLVVLVLTTAVTWQIVSAADTQVSDRPIGAIEIGDSTTSLGSGSSTDTGALGTSAPTTEATSPASSTPSATGSTSPTSPTTTVTEGNEEWSLKTVVTAGGTVVLRFRDEAAELVAATPLPGFGVEVDDSGPPRVRVEFDNGVIEVRIEAEWRDGALDVRVVDED